MTVQRQIGVQFFEALMTLHSDSMILRGVQKTVSTNQSNFNSV